MRNLIIKLLTNVLRQLSQARHTQPVSIEVEKDILELANEYNASPNLETLQVVLRKSFMRGHTLGYARLADTIPGAFIGLLVQYKERMDTANWFNPDTIEGKARIDQMIYLLESVRDYTEVETTSVIHGSEDMDIEVRIHITGDSKTGKDHHYAKTS